MMSSTVDSSGMLMVFEIAPEMNGCTAAIMRTWPMWWMKRLPFCGRKLQSKTGRCSGFRAGAPSMVPVESMWLTICFHLLRRVAELDQRLRHGVVDDLDHAAADQLLVLHQRQIRLDAGGVAIHHEADGAGGREHGGLRVAEAAPSRRARRHRSSTLRQPRTDPAERAGCRCRSPRSSACGSRRGTVLRCRR